MTCALVEDGEKVLALIQGGEGYRTEFKEGKNTAAGNRSSERGEEFWVTLYSRK